MSSKKITADVLKKWQACREGFVWYVQKFPNGADLDTSISVLCENKHADWAQWLFDKSVNDEEFKDQTLKGFQNTGHQNTGHQNTGNGNTGNWNTGNWNTGNWNTGNWNTGHQNTGHRNTGHRNTGHQNTGHQNTGNWNTGDWNTGDWNTGDWNTGYFNTTTPEDILIFNKPCLRSVWDSCCKPILIFNVVLTWWVTESEMTDEEKRADPNFYMRGGQLRNRTYKEAWKLAYDKASLDDRELLKQLPNFDANVFFEISGIDLREQKIPEPIADSV